MALWHVSQTKKLEFKKVQKMEKEERGVGRCTVGANGSIACNVLCPSKDVATGILNPKVDTFI